MVSSELHQVITLVIQKIHQVFSEAKNLHHLQSMKPCEVGLDDEPTSKDQQIHVTVRLY